MEYFVWHEIPAVYHKLPQSDCGSLLLVIKRKQKDIISIVVAMTTILLCHAIFDAMLGVWKCNFN